MPKLISHSPLSGEAGCTTSPPPAADSEKLPFALSPERLRRRLLERLDRDGEDSAEQLFAHALFSRLPAAWALFHDASRGPLRAWLSAFTRHDDLIDQAIETVYARVHSESRRDRGESLRIPFPRFFEWLKLSCLIELAGEISDVGQNRLDQTSSPLAPLAKPLRGCPSPHDLVAVTADETHVSACHRCSTALRLIQSDGKTSLVESLLGEPTTSEHDLTHGPAIHLPSAITLLLLLILLPWLAIGFESEGAPTGDSDQTRLIELLKNSEFDPALRTLGSAPPTGLEQLRPSWPEDRERRLFEIVRGGAPSAVGAILTPRGTITQSAPMIELSPELPAVPGNLTIVDTDSGAVVYQADLDETEQAHVVAPPLRSGGNYRVTLGGLRGAGGYVVSSDFHVAPRDEWLRVDAERERIRVQIDTPKIQSFFDAHLLRAAGYSELSLREWTTLASQFPGATYPLEEAALTLKDLHRDAEAWQLASSIQRCHPNRAEASTPPPPAD